MTVETTISRAGPYAGAGTVGPFPVPFRFLENSHLRLLKTNVATGAVSTLVLDADYTVTGAGNETGAVTLAAVLPVGFTLTVLRNVPATQEADYVENDPFPAESHEMALDKLTMLVQQQGELQSRALVVPATDPIASRELPSAEARARRYLSFNELGEPVATTFDIDAISQASQAAIDAAARAANSEADAETAAAIAVERAEFVKNTVDGVTPTVARFSGNGAQTVYTLPSFPGAEENTDVFISGVYQQKDTYSVDGDKLTFNAAPPVGTNNIEVNMAPNVALAIGDATGIRIDDNGTIRSLDSYVKETRADVDTLDSRADTLESRASELEKNTVRRKNYAELRAYSGPATIVDLTDDGIFGRFHVVSSGSENGGTLIVGADGRKWKREFEGVINVRWFGAQGDGVADDTAAIQSVIGYSLVLPSVGRVIFFPAGVYRITAPLNFTGGTGNTPITIRGEGWSYDGVQGGTVILGQTGGWMCDCTGVQWLSFEDIVLKGSGPNASGGGVLLARASVGVRYDHCIYMHHVLIDIDSKPGFSVVGSVALGNNGAEVGMYTHCWFRADTPLTMTYNNELGFVSPYQTIGWPLSSTDNKYISCQFQATRYHATVIFGCGNVDFDTCYWGVSDTNTRQVSHAILLRPGTNPNSTAYHNHGIHLKGQCEVFEAFLDIEDSKVYGCYVDVMMPEPKQPYVYVAQPTELYDCNFRIQHFPDKSQNGAGSIGYAVVHPGGGQAVMYGGSIDLFPGTPDDYVSNSTNLKLVGTVVRGNGVPVAGVPGLIDAASTFQASGTDGIYFTGMKRLTGVGPTPVVAIGEIGIGTSQSATATAGSNGAPPSAVDGYLIVNLGGNNVKIPYYKP